MGPEHFPELKRKASATRRVTVSMKCPDETSPQATQISAPGVGWGGVGGCYQAFRNWRWRLHDPENGLNAAQVCALQWGVYSV